MKTLLIHSVRVSFLSGITALALLGTNLARAQSPFQYLEQALTGVIGMAANVDGLNLDYAPGNSLVGVYLGSGQSITYRLWLEPGVRYVVLGAADEHVRDLDLVAKNSDGRILNEDTESDACPVLVFTATDRNWVALEIRNVRSRRSGFCVLLILRETNGGRLEIRKLAEALDNALTLSRSAALYSTKFAEGTFCLFGGRVRAGSSSYIYNMSPEPGRYFLLTAGSDNINDVDSQVIAQDRVDDPSGRKIAEDEDADSLAVCQFDVEVGTEYRMEHKNYSSSDNSSGFVFSCLLRR